MANPFRYFNSSPEVIRLVVMMYVKYPLSLRNVEDLLAERGIDVNHETIRFWWNRFGPMFAAEDFQSGASSRQPRNLQTEALRCAGRVARRHGLIAARVWTFRANADALRLV